MQEPKTEITKELVLEALREIYDPEIPVNIVDLGLVYDIKIFDDWVGVKMTLTTPGCGMGDYIVNQTRQRILKIPGVADGDVRLIWEPAWTTSRMSDEAKKKLGVMN